MNYARNVVAALCCLGSALTIGAVEPPQPYGAVPSEAQLNWHKVELYGLVCFNMPTFTNEEWAFGDQPASRFNPTDFSADQIVTSAKAGGLRGLVLVTKHHGGLCLWPSSTTEYSVKNSPWRDGKGDIVKELSDACRKHGLQFGAYLSPWDRNHPEYGRPAYVEAYRQQWRELMTNYGDLFMLWLDGANGGTGYYGGARGRRTIDRSTYYGWDTTFEMMRELQPGAVIFSDIGPGVRWVGNEGGHANDPCWATITYPLVGGKKAGPGSSISRQLLGSGLRNGEQWTPAEADVSIRPGWYYHPAQNGRVRTPQNLVNLYFQTVGRGASLNLGLPPDRRGRMHDNDVKSLKMFGDWQRETFGVNLAADATATATHTRDNQATYAAANVLDGKHDTYWSTNDDIQESALVLDLGKDVAFNVVSLRECLPLGHRIDDWALDAWQDGQWTEFARGAAIGARRLVRAEEMTARKVRLRITKAAACPAISEFALHREPEWIRKQPVTADTPDLGVSKRGWKILSCSFEAPGGGQAQRAIDGNPKTLWHTHGPDGERGAPQYVAIDMGKPTAIKSFLYMPRRDGTTRAIVDQYAFYVSQDGKQWSEPVAQGEFDNVAANPIQQVVSLKAPVTARYFKFVALHSANGIPLCAAELGVAQ